MPVKKMDWKPDVIKYLISVIKKDSYTASEIAEMVSKKFNVSCNKNQIIGKADRLGMPIRRQNRNAKSARSKFWTLEKITKFWEMWEQNKPVGDIGSEFGVAPATVARAAKNYGFPPRNLNEVRYQSTQQKTKYVVQKPKAPGTVLIERSMNAFHNPAAKSLTIFELKRNSCRFIVGDTMTDNYRYCGADVPQNSSVPYCEICKKIVYYPSRMQQELIRNQGEK